MSRNDPLEIPFGLAAAESMPGWRDRLVWPVPYGRLLEATHAQLTAVLVYARGLAQSAEHDERASLGRDAVLLSAHELLASSRARLQAALAIDAELEAGIRLAGGPAELDWLAGRIGRLDDVPDARELSAAQRAAARGGGLRRLARAASWSPLPRLPRAVLAPRILAVSHNALLAAEARRAPIAIGFHHAAGLLAGIRASARFDSPAAAPDTMFALEHSFAGALVPDVGLSEPVRRRLAALVTRSVRPALARAVADLAALRSARMPAWALWSGTGGYYPARALGLELLRRDGAVTRFDHGGGGGLIDSAEVIALMEYAVSSRLVVATPAQAALFRALDPERFLARSVEVSGGAGDPTFRVKVRPARMRRPRRPRVLYASTALLGYRQVFPPLLPDLVYLDWQLRLAEMLAKLQIKLVCKPHPEGILKGRRHPLADLASVTDQPFETALAQADVVVWDYGSSTAFWQSLCSDRPVVLVDLGNAPRTPAGERLVRARCRVLDAQYDDRGRPSVDPEALAEAVLGAAGAPDPAPVRALLAGKS
ncbi:MAG: hypothetical protein ACREGL_01680 [Alphaproteobacteria bacterium]